MLPLGEQCIVPPYIQRFPTISRTIINRNDGRNGCAANSYGLFIYKFVFLLCIRGSFILSKFLLICYFYYQLVLSTLPQRTLKYLRTIASPLPRKMRAQSFTWSVRMQHRNWPVCLQLYHLHENSRPYAVPESAHAFSLSTNETTFNLEKEDF